jgi:cell division septation protein DedD
VERDGATLIVAILGATDQWGDTRNLLEFGFDNIEALRAGTPVTPKPSLHPTVEKLPAMVLAPRQANAAEPFGEAYVLQLATFRDSPRAEALLKRVKEKGFSAFVEKVSAARNQSAYRVRVGPYSDRAHAREVADQLLSKIGYKAILLPVQARLRSRAG